MLPRVFIPQIVFRFNHELRKLVPVYDFSSAKEHGQLTPVLDDNDNTDFIGRLVPKVKNKLSDFTHEDYLLAVGDPCLIAICAGIIAKSQKRFVMLKWQREIKMYVKTEISL